MIKNIYSISNTICINNKKSGFTLIELSVVLVVIGLIIGGILVGKNLIETANIRAQTSQIHNIEAQTTTFQLKYNCLPGDCPNATSLFGTSFGTSTINNGDGDGNIRSIYTYSTSYTAGECTHPDVSGEVSQHLLQLNLAGIGKYTANGILDTTILTVKKATVGREYTATAYGNGTGLFISCLSSLLQPTYTPLFLRTGNIIVIGAAASSYGRIGYAVGTYGANWYGNYGYYGAGLPIDPIGIPADVVRQIDEKTDDGKPSKGRFGIITGDTACAANVAAYPSPGNYCRVTAGKKIN